MLEAFLFVAELIAEIAGAVFESMPVVRDAICVAMAVLFALCYVADLIVHCRKLL